MTQKSSLKEFIRYCFSNVLGMVSISLYILADTFFVSKGLGTNGLAALNIAIPVYSFVNGIGLMLGIGGATKYLVLKTQNDLKKAKGAFSNALILAGIFSCIFVIIGIFFSGYFSTLLGADKEVFDMTNIYMKVLLLFAPVFILNNVLVCFARNDGKPRLAMSAMIIGSLSNILLDYIFIFPLKMGMFGAVFATGLSALISLIILILYKIKAGEKNKVPLVKISPDFSMIRSVLTLGFPSLVTELSSGIVIIVFNNIIFGLHGNVGVAAYGIIANISIIVIAIYTGIAQGIQPLTSKAYGADNLTVAKHVLRYAIITMLMLSIIIYLIIFIFADPIAHIFNSQNNDSLQKMAVWGLKLYFTSIVFVGFNIITSMFFSSIERPIYAHIISLLRGLIIIIPLAYLFSFLAGITGVWLSFLAAEGLVAIISIMALKVFKKPKTLSLSKSR